MELEFFLLDADYAEEDSQSVVRLFGKAEDGETVVATARNFAPYFYYIPENDINSVEDKFKGFEKDDLKVKDVKKVEKVLDPEGEEVEALQVFAYRSSDLKKLRDYFKKNEGLGKDGFYEFSLNFYKRYLIDKNLKPASWVRVKGEEGESSDFGISLDIEEVEVLDEDREESLKTMAFDLESYEEGGNNKIIILSLFSEGMEKVLTYEEGDYEKDVENLKDEKELIERFLEIIEDEDPDIITTYNGDDFDFQLLRERAEEYGIELGLGRDGSKMAFKRRTRSSAARLKGRVHVDLYRFVDQILSPQLETEVLTLDAVAKELLGEEKKEMKLEEILRSWKERENLEKLTRYCLRDSELTHRLAEELLPQIFSLSRVTGQLPFDVSRMSYGQLVEWYLLQEANPERISPERPKYKEIQERAKQSPYEGGFVKEPIPGIHEEITVLDFQSLYPTIIVSYNISPETKNCECCKDENQVPGLDVWFCQEERGFIPELVEELIGERNEIKKQMQEVRKGKQEYRNLNNRQYALKVLANSIYGYYGYSGARWYCRECAEATSALGRKWIKEVMRMAEEEGFEVIYGDTDSLMIKDGKTEEFIEKINSQLPGIMNLELEGLFKRGIFASKEGGGGTKKKYALLDSNDNLKIRGFETVRRDWCELAKRTQREILSIVLEENSRKKAVARAQEIMKNLKNKEVELQDLIIYTQLNKGLDEYKSIGPHVAAARKLRDEGKDVDEGSVIMYVITEGSGSISDRAEPVELVELEDVDTGYYINNQIIPACLRVLKVLGVDEKELKGKGTQESLGDFTE
ncbi:MAG: DNA-directed DNA polymerase [Candidatus Aenigmatarchaeota archaeon]